jgi:hypothetical protein
MSFIRLIIWGLLFYLVYRIVGNVMKVVRGYNGKAENKIKQNKNSKYKISNEDVIEAHFEEITTKTADKSKEKV